MHGEAARMRHRPRASVIDDGHGSVRLGEGENRRLTAVVVSRTEPIEPVVERKECVDAIDPHFGGPSPRGDPTKIRA
jgi:hypothetical protein